MIAQQEVCVRRHDELRIRTLVSVIRRHVILFEGLTVDEYLPCVYADVVTSQSDNTFNEAFRRVSRVVENHDIAPPNRLDRKSTRLNSSHRCISYAVFCL